MPRKKQKPPRKVYCQHCSQLLLVKRTNVVALCVATCQYKGGVVRERSDITGVVVATERNARNNCKHFRRFGSLKSRAFKRELLESLGNASKARIEEYPSETRTKPRRVEEPVQAEEPIEEALTIEPAESTEEAESMEISDSERVDGDNGDAGAEGKSRGHGRGTRGHRHRTVVREGGSDVHGGVGDDPDRGERSNRQEVVAESDIDHPSTDGDSGR